MHCLKSKEQKASALLSILEIRKVLNKIPLLSPFMF